MWNCDDNFNGNVWYRLLYNGMNIRMPESCTSYYRCGTSVTFWLNGSHPQISDGIITRQACGSWMNGGCCEYSVLIQVKACPANYYVYEFFSPNICYAAYCTDVNSITPITDPVKVNSTAAPASSDPCYNYTALDQPWRATTADGSYVADKYFSWNGWYRLMYYGMNIWMPEICTTYNKCGTSVTFWLNGSHPQISDGIISRQACGSWTRGCCEYSESIRVKACSENYYVYEFVSPDVKASQGYAAYCADVNSITPITEPMKVDSTTAAEVPPNITVSEGCQVNFTSQCAEDLFNQIQNISAQVLRLQDVTTYLGMVLNTQEQLLKLEAANPEKLVSYGNAVLNTTEKLVSTLVTPTETSYNLSISLKGLDLQVFAVGPNASMNKIPQLSLGSTQMEIDLIQISKNNNGSAAVAFMSYSNMNSMLKPSFFNTTDNDTVKTMMSTVVSATLPKTSDTRLTKPVNFTMKHIVETDPIDTLSCVYWK
uniref:GAIN-B domain-containing protein n=1 Tax=Astyanax mexicanus TaxID=7994 RepID=A0A8B9HD36_ASTMX